MAYAKLETQDVKRKTKDVRRQTRNVLYKVLETFAKPKIVILRTVGAVRNISKFGTITGFEILLPPRRDQNDKFRG